MIYSIIKKEGQKLTITASYNTIEDAKEHLKNSCSYVSDTGWNGTKGKEEYEICDSELFATINDNADFNHLEAQIDTSLQRDPTACEMCEEELSGIGGEFVKKSCENCPYNDEEESF